MDTLILIGQIVAVILGGMTFLGSIPLLLRLSWPAPALWFIKLYASALSTTVVLLSVMSTIIGLTTGSVFISALGLYGILIFSLHIARVTRPPKASSNFEKAFGSQWEARIDVPQRRYFLPRRIVMRLPPVPKPRLEQNIAFTTIPESDRQLLCDVWQPAEDVTPSGLAFIYLHGSAWYFLDKDLGTRPFFAHLAAQGHVIMDAAYRHAPETDMMGMVHDVKRAIAWMKQHAGAYGVNPDCIVVGGGSAGGHLALLAAYTERDALFTPEELEGIDTKACAVISLYGPAHLEAMYYHTNQHLTTREIPGRPKKNVPTEMPGWIRKSMGADYYRLGFDKGFENAGSFAPLLGGHPDECPEIYERFSPVMHVHEDCPPTLLIHGDHDLMAPVKSTRELFTRLRNANVPVVMHIFPQTDHAFDLQLPVVSPSAHNAIYDVERFLALHVRSFDYPKRVTKETEEFQLK